MSLEPMYGLLGRRPVRTVMLPTGGFRMEGFDHTTGEFNSEPSLFITIHVDYYTGEDVDFTPLSKDEFDDYVLKLRKNLGFDVSEPYFFPKHPRW
jgi:hypothetical protein